MWPGSPEGSRPVFDRSPRVPPAVRTVPASKAGNPGTTTEDRPWRSGPGATGCQCCRYSVVPGRGSAADAEPLPDRAVAVDVLLGQVLQQPAAAADQQQQPAAAVVVVFVHLQVLGQVVDPPGQQRNLDFRRTGVTLTGRVLRQDLFLGGGIERHVTP